MSLRVCLRSRRGVFVPAELADLEQLLWRLAQGGGVMAASPPVPRYRSPLGLDLHGLFITFCLDRGLQYLLYSYLEHYRCVCGTMMSAASLNVRQTLRPPQVDAQKLSPPGQSQPVGESALV